MDIDMASSPKSSNLGTPKSSSSFMPAFLIGNMNTPVNQAKSLQSAVGSVPASSTSLLKVSALFQVVIESEQTHINILQSSDNPQLQRFEVHPPKA